jgi:hypothetical protein
MKPSAGVALIILLAVAPLLLPVAAFSPNFTFLKQVTLQFRYAGDGVYCEEQSVKLLGFGKTLRYGPIKSASDDVLPAVTPPGEPGRGEMISTLALQAPDGIHHPLMSMSGSVSGQMSAGINRFIQHPSGAPLVLVRSQPYPVGYVLFDALGLVLLFVILRFWTAPLCLAACRKLNGAPAKDVAEPFIRILGRAGNMATWASKR